MKRHKTMKRVAVPVAIGGVVALVAIVAAGLMTGTGDAAATAAPTNSAPPTIAGTAEEGKTLTASQGTWSGSEPIDYAYAWRRCDADGGSCSTISGAKATTYTLKAVDAGNTLRVTVAAKNATARNRDLRSDGRRQGCRCPAAVERLWQAEQRDDRDRRRRSAGTAPGRPGAGRSEHDHVRHDTVTAKFHVTACGAAVQGALVYVTAVPYNQFSIPNEQATGADGWATLEMHRLDGFPATQKQQLLVMFARARKSGENLLAGVSSRRLVSFRVTR